MKKNYQILAVDMDGTLLNSRKEISEKNQDAINAALDAGKIVIFCTGRCIAELEHFFAIFPKMRYVLCESGACIYDLQERKAISRRSFPPELVKTILEDTAKRDIMMQVLIDDAAIMNIRDVNNLPHFQMAHYQRHFEQTGKNVEDVLASCREHGWIADKICLYHTDAAAREETKTRLLAAGYPLAMVFAEKTSLEISLEGVDKGNGLQILCDYLKIPMEETIAVGDSYNDQAVLLRAGLAAAVGNAVEEIKKICHIVVADNDHDGVAEVIETYLL